MRGLMRFLARFILLLPATLCAQPAADPATLVERVESAYENLAYDDAEALARNALARFEAFSPDQLIRLHTTLALILYARGEELEAAEQFRGALTLSPDLRLDPLLVSPVTLAFFEETKAAFVRERNVEDSPEVAIRYIQLYDERPAATWRSAVLPGWGQRYKGEGAKGWVMTGLWVATLGGAAVAHIQRQDARNVYLAETDPALVADRFDTYNTWHKARGGLLIGAMAVWVYAAVDALTSGGPQSSLQISATPSGISIGLRF